MPPPVCNGMRGWPGDWDQAVQSESSSACVAGTQSLRGHAVQMLLLLSYVMNLDLRLLSVFFWLFLHDSRTRQCPSRLHAFLELRA